MRYVFIALTALSCAFGDPIATYTFTGTADGTINGTTFRDAKLTVTASGDSKLCISKRRKIGRAHV